MRKHRRPVGLNTKVVENPLADTERMRMRVGLMLLALVAALFSARFASAEEDAAKAYEERLKQARTNAALQNAVNNAQTPEQKKAAQRALQDAQSKMQAKKDMADFKQKTLDNLASIKEMFAKAEDNWKNKLYGEAAPLYHSVSMATVPGAEQFVETARGRMVEMEDLAKQRLNAADDADLKREYVKEVEELAYINRECALTKTREVALRRLVNLKSKPEVSGYVELAQAEGFEADGKLMESVKLYQAIAANPRYDNTVPSLKAKRKLEELSKNVETREKIKSEVDARADREAPVLISSAKNFVSNNRPKQAIEKLQLVIEKFPESKHAEEAKKLLSELK